MASAEASAPPEFPEDYDGGVGSSSSAAGPSAPPPAAVAFEPSAPVVVEEEDSYGPNFSYASVAGPSASSHGVAPDSRVQEPLPKYER